MSASMQNFNNQMKDKAFVLGYFKGCENGNDVTQRLIRDNATINSPDLICRLVGWLNEAGVVDENAQIQAQQSMNTMNLPSTQGTSETGTAAPNPAVTNGSEETSSPSSSTANPTASETTSPTSTSNEKADGFTFGSNE